MRAEILFGDEAGSLPKDCPARARIQLRMRGHRQALNSAVGQFSAVLDVTSALRVNGEAKAAQDGHNLRAG